MIYLGIDPGTATTGFGVIQKQKGKRPEYAILDFGVILTSKAHSDAQRLAILYEDLSSIIKRHKPARVAVEKLYFTSNQTTAMTVSQSRGVILLACMQAGLEIFEFTPLQVKNILCGYGKADKHQVQNMVKLTFGLKQIPKPDDAADALAIALCAAETKR